MKKIVLLFLTAAATCAQLPAATGDFLYLTVTRASGVEKSYELKNLKITFTAADMKFNGNGKEDIVPLSELANAKMRFTELAETLELPASTVKSRFHYGIERLKTLL